MDERFNQFLFSWLTYVFISLAFLGLDSLGGFNFAKSALDRAANPITQTMGLIYNQLSFPLKALKFSVTGASRIADLERRLAEATVNTLNTDDLEAENASLRVLLGSMPKEFKATPVQVISIGDKIIISAGSAQGLKTGDMLVSQDFVLIGRLDRVSVNAGWATTPTNPSSYIPVIVKNSQTTGVVTIDNGQLVMDRVEQSASLAVGDVIVTSGVDQLYLPNIPVGTIKAISSKPADIYKKATIELFYLPGTHAFILAN